MGTQELALSLLVSVAVGFAAAVPVTPIFCLLRKLFYVPFIRRHLVEEAVHKGHVVQARLKKDYGDYKEDKALGQITTGRRRAVYNYEYQGYRYHYRCITSSKPSAELTLYFLRSPRKACLSKELGLLESHWLRYYIRIALLILLANFGLLIFTGGLGT